MKNPSRYRQSFTKKLAWTLFILLSLCGSAGAQGSGAPVLNGISPNFGNLGSSVEVTLTGSNLAGATAVAVSGGGVTVSNISAASASVTATLTINSGTSLGYRQITVTTPSGTSNGRTFTITPLSAPALSMISPDSGTIGSSVNVTLTGTNLGCVGTTVAISGSDVTLDGTSACGPASLTATFTISSSATLGPRQVTVTTPSGTSNAVNFNVISTLPAPVLNTISPNFGNLGSSVEVTLTGLNLADATAVAVSGSGVTASNINAASTSVTAMLTISSGASLGYRQITVTTPAGTSNGRTFTILPVLPAPTLSMISPNSGIIGSSVNVTLSGTNFVCPGTTVAISGSGVTLNGTSACSPTLLTATFIVSSTATLGPRQVTVTAPSGTSNAVNFNVMSTLPAPILNTISPNFGSPGRFVDVTLEGANFGNGVSSVSVSGTGVTVNNVNATSTMLTATLAVIPGASLGYRQVTVATPGGSSNTRTFTILPATQSLPAPTLSGMSPNVGEAGQQVTATLTGTNFVPETEVLAGDITVGSVNPVNATTLTASFTLPALAGDRNVQVRTPSGTSNSVAFTVRAAITASAGPGGSISPSGVVPVSAGASQTFTITPDTGYHVAYISVDGVSAGLVTSYTFTNVTSNHTIAVTFAANTTTTSNWTTLAPMQTARLFLSAAEIGGKLYAVGGYDTAVNRDTPAFEAHDPSTNTWGTLASLPDLGDGNSGRYQATAGVIDGELYLAGGWRTSPPLPTSSLLVYNPTTNSWRTRQSMPALSACSSGGVINRKFYVLSPCDGFSGWRYDFYVYDPDTDIWSAETSSPALHVNAGAAVLDGKLYIIGGHNGSGPTSRVDVFDPATHSWTNLQSMPTARENVMAATIGGKIYAVGGNPNGAATAIVEVYDPSTNTWTTGDPLPVARNAAAAVAISGKIYVVGGENGGVAVNTLFVYTTGWVSLATMPTPRWDLTAAELSGKLYAVGGWNSSGPSSAVNSYDPATDQWTTLASLPGPRSSGTLGAIDGKLYLAGGWSQSLPNSSLFMYDPAANTWTSKASLPTLSGCSAGGVIDRKLYVYSPCDGFNGYARSFFMYNPDTDTWTLSASPPNPYTASRSSTHISAAAAVVNGKLYLIGGAEYDGSSTSASGRVDVYDPATNSWSAAASMPTARWGFAAAALGGKIYAAGGWTGTALATATEVYDPATNTWSAAAPILTPRSSVAGAAVNGKFYVVGGSSGNNIAPGTLEAYAPLFSIVKTMTFNAGSGGPLSYSENGMTVISRYPDGPHLHFNNYGLLWNHYGCCSRPYEFHMNGTPFRLISIDIAGSSSPSVWRTNTGVSVTVPGTPGTFTFPETFTGVTSVFWDQESGETFIDNLVFATSN